MTRRFLTNITAKDGFIAALSFDRNFDTNSEILLWRQSQSSPTASFDDPTYALEINERGKAAQLQISVQHLDSIRCACSILVAFRTCIRRYHIGIELNNSMNGFSAELQAECEATIDSPMQSIAFDFRGDFCVSCEGTKVVVRTGQLRRLRILTGTNSQPYKFAHFCGHNSSWIIAANERGAITVRYDRLFSIERIKYPFYVKEIIYTIVGNIHRLISFDRRAGALMTIA